jgi:cytochrome P450
MTESVTSQSDIALFSKEVMLDPVLWQLAANRQEWDLVRSDPALVPSACNEALRFHAPIQMFTRVIRQDWTADGTSLQAGSRVLALFGSANRDERHYDDPDRFDVLRDSRDHLGFGHGIHSCVGAPLARLEIHSLLGALSRRVTRMEADEPAWRVGNLVRKLRSLPVSIASLSRTR